MSNINITAKELEAMKAVDWSEYGDHITDAVWSWSVHENMDMDVKARGGVLASLSKKGVLHVDNSGDIDEDCIYFTEMGAKLFIEMVGAENVGHYIPEGF